MTFILSSYNQDLSTLFIVTVDKGVTIKNVAYFAMVELFFELNNDIIHDLMYKIIYYRGLL